MRALPQRGSGRLRRSESGMDVYGIITEADYRETQRRRGPLAQALAEHRRTAKSHIEKVL